MWHLFQNREQAGQILADKLYRYGGLPGVIVLGLPRGGVPVAFEVSELLECDLDVFVVRKIGVPGQEELAMGAVAAGNIRLLNAEVVETLRIPRDVIDALADKQVLEVQRRQLLYRAAGPANLVGKTVILVDDGIATGATMMVAVRAAKAAGAAKVVAAAPVASEKAVKQLRALAEAVVTIETPEPFGSVGQWYAEFPQVTDEEVCALLRRARSRSHPHSFAV